MSRNVTKKIGIWLLAIGLLVVHILLRSTAQAEETDARKHFLSKEGECTIGFPVQPAMVQQSLPLPDQEQKLYYDIYIAPCEEKGILMLLIATYPQPLTGGHEVAGLEGLLEGIVGHHPENTLIFSQLLQHGKYPALSFLVQSTTSYFRGHALMVGNKLFLIAMEGKKTHVDEETFLRFVKSFQLLKK